MLNKINKEQKLYVMVAGEGLTCHGFEALNRQATALRAWYLERNNQAIPAIPKRLGTKKHFEACQEVIAKVAQYCQQTHVQCPIELSPQLKGIEGRRVEVVTLQGERRRFIVGRSTGWLVNHVEVLRRNSNGGMPAEKEYKTVVVL